MLNAECSLIQSDWALKGKGSRKAHERLGLANCSPLAQPALRTPARTNALAMRMSSTSTMGDKALSTAPLPEAPLSPSVSSMIRSA